MIYRIGKFIVNEFIYNGHLQSLGAASIVYVASRLLNYPVSISLLFITYLIFQTIYFHDRYQGFYQDHTTNKERTNHLRKYYHIFPLLIITILVITAMMLASFASYPTLVFSFIILIFGFLYPVIFKKITKYIPLFKNFYVASVFTLLVFFPSIYWSGGFLFNNIVWVLLGFVFVASMISQIILDIKDRQSDQKEGLLTLAVLLNTNKIMVVLWILNIFIFISALFSFFILSSYKTIALLAVVTFIFNGYTLHNISHDNRRGYILAAGQYLLWPLVLVLLSNG